MPRPELAEILLADPPAAWEALGFTVDGGGISLGGVRIRLGAEGSGIAGLKLRGLGHGHDLDGLPMTGGESTPPAPAEHPNGALGIDHVVAITPDLQGTTRKLVAAGFDHRPSPASQEFFVLGPCLLELAGNPETTPRLWGLTLVVADLDDAARRLGDRLGPVKQAVQPGRRIATIRAAEAGIGAPLALMSPR
jgi:hypothetical protein